MKPDRGKYKFASIFKFSPMKYFFFLAIVSFFLSCNKKVIEPLASAKDCISAHTEKHIDFLPQPVEPFPIAKPAWKEYDHIFPHWYYNRILFNPKDGNEIAFHRRYYKKQDPKNGTNELCIYNFCTDELTVVTKEINYDLDWSSTGWFIFVGRDNNIWKVKSNGDSLTQVSFKGLHNSDPCWSEDGSKFIFGSEREGSAFVFIADNKGQIVDTIYSRPRGDDQWLVGLNFKWIGDSIYIDIGANTAYMGILDLNTKEFTKLRVVPSPWRCTGWKRYDKVSNSVIWIGEKDGFANILGSTNLKTKETMILLDKRELWEGFLICNPSPNGKKIILSKGNVLESKPLYMKLEMVPYIVDMDGKNERRILLPE